VDAVCETDSRRLGVKMWTCRKNVCNFSVEIGTHDKLPIYSCAAVFYKNERQSDSIGCKGCRDEAYSSLRGTVQPYGTCDPGFMLVTDLTSLGFGPLHQKVINIKKKR